MKSWVSFYLWALFIIGVSVWYSRDVEHAPVYKGSINSIFGDRVTKYINRTVSGRCETSNVHYQVSGEVVARKQKSIHYSGLLSVGEMFSQKGKFNIEELHSGKLALLRIDCPGKDGKWISYIDEEFKDRLPSSVRREN